MAECTSRLAHQHGDVLICEITADHDVDGLAGDIHQAACAECSDGLIRWVSGIDESGA